MTRDDLQKLLTTAYTEGFMNSSEGFNAEYPFEWHEGEMKSSRRWFDKMERSIYKILDIVFPPERTEV
jgi:hypothetical protein